MRLDILHLIFSKLIVLDVNAPREDIDAAEYDSEVDMFAMDEEHEVTDGNRMRHQVAHTLDVCMDKLLNFFILECHDLSTGQLSWEKTKGEYRKKDTFKAHKVCKYKNQVADAIGCIDL